MAIGCSPRTHLEDDERSVDTLQRAVLQAGLHDVIAHGGIRADLCHFHLRGGGRAEVLRQSAETREGGHFQELHGRQGSQEERNGSIPVQRSRRIRWGHAARLAQFLGHDTSCCVCFINRRCSP